MAQRSASGGGTRARPGSAQKGSWGSDTSAFQIVTPGSFAGGASNEGARQAGDGDTPGADSGGNSLDSFEQGAVFGPLMHGISRRPGPRCQILRACLL